MPLLPAIHSASPSLRVTPSLPPRVSMALLTKLVCWRLGLPLGSCGGQVNDSGAGLHSSGLLPSLPRWWFKVPLSQNHPHSKPPRRGTYNQAVPHTGCRFILFPSRSSGRQRCLPLQGDPWPNHLLQGTPRYPTTRTANASTVLPSTYINLTASYAHPCTYTDTAFPSCDRQTVIQWYVIQDMCAIKWSCQHISQPPRD